MKGTYINETPPIDVFISPDLPYIKKILDIIDSITSKYYSLKSYNEKLKSLLIEHHKAVYNYSRSRLKVDDFVNIANMVLIEGIISRSLNIYEGILREFDNNNLFSFHCLMRAHIETLSLICYVNDNPNYIINAVNGMKNSIDNSEKHQNFPLAGILKMISNANKKYKKLEENYNILSEYIHPNAISLATNLNINIPNIVLRTHIDKIPEQQALTNMDLLVKWTEYIFLELELLDKTILEMEEKEKSKIK